MRQEILFQLCMQNLACILYIWLKMAYNDLHGSFWPLYGLRTDHLHAAFLSGKALSRIGWYYD